MTTTTKTTKTWTIVRYLRDTMATVGKGYRTLEAAERAQARMYAADTKGADYFIEAR